VASDVFTMDSFTVGDALHTDGHKPLVLADSHATGAYVLWRARRAMRNAVTRQGCLLLRERCSTHLFTSPPRSDSGSSVVCSVSGTTAKDWDVR
jgi:hypothetical protein